MLQYQYTTSRSSNETTVLCRYIERTEIYKKDR